MYFVEIRKEYIRLGDGFKALTQAFEQDPYIEKQSDNLKQAVNRTSATYNEIGALFGRQHKCDVNPLVERLCDYHSVLSCVPQIVQVQRGTVQTVRECQHSVDNGKMNKDEFSVTVQRAAVISCVQAAEINFFHQEHIRDFNNMMRTYLTAQIDFHHEVSLRDLVALIKT